VPESSQLTEDTATPLVRTTTTKPLTTTTSGKITIMLDVTPKIVSGRANATVDNVEEPPIDEATGITNTDI